ncbi:MAG: type VI secretion system baseplate subunit TssK, partial [Bilophila sp.]
PENGNGNNVVSTDDPSEVPETIRFVVSQNPESVPDLQGQGPAAQLRLLRYNARLLFGSESERSGESLRIPLATLEREGEKVTVSHQFAPPCVDIKAIPVLREMFKDVRDTVLSRARQLEEYKIVAGEGAAAVATSAQSIALFTILGVLARNAPTLEHLFEAPTLHPWAAYGALRQLVGELSIFSSELSPLGETIQGRRVLPAYDHEALASCFAAAKSIITRLVDTLVVGPAYMLRLEPEGDLLTTTIPTSAMGSEFRAWLLLRSAHPAADMVGRLRLSMKCGAMTDIRALVSNALPGIRLLHADTPPAGLPRRADTTYYAVDQDDSLWRDVQNQGKLTLFFPNAPDDLLVHLAIIAR